MEYKTDPNTGPHRNPKDEKNSAMAIFYSTDSLNFYGIEA